MGFKTIQMDISAYEESGSHKGSARFANQLAAEFEFDHHFLAGLLDEINLIVQTRIEDYDESRRAEETEAD